MGKLGEYVCLSLNRVFPRRQIPGGDSGGFSPEVKSTWTDELVASFGSYVDLKDKMALDMGCGFGGKTILYAERGCREIIGVDINPHFVKHASDFSKRNGISNAKFVNGSIEAIPFESGQFDLIFIHGTLEHIRRDFLIAGLRECRRVLKNDGRICITFPPWTSHHAAHLYGHIRIPWSHLLFSGSTLVSVLEGMGEENADEGRRESSAIEIFQGLNRLTVEEFEDLAKELDFKILKLGYRMIKDWKYLEYVPMLNRYMIIRVDAVLSK